MKNLSYLEAVSALKEGRCKAIESTVTAFQYQIHKDNIQDVSMVGVNPSVKEILGQWKLIEPVIKPIPGDIWIGPSGQKWFVFKTGTTNDMIREDGYIIPLDKVQHKYNGWKRVFPEVAE